MPKKVFITRMIPSVGIEMLRSQGFEIDVSDLNRPLTKDELIGHLKAKPYDAVLSLLTDKIDKDVIDCAPTVKIFANYAIGFDNFTAIDYAKAKGVFLTNTPHGGVDRVAEHAWALILALTCRVVEADDYVRCGKYCGWDPMIFQGTKVRGKTLGLIGAGRIGTEVARIGAMGFGMRIVYTDLVRNTTIEELTGATYWDNPEEVIRQADIISLHTPLNEHTHHLLNADRLAMMKPTAYIVNTARGPVIDEKALVEILKAGKIAGAGLDVFEDEPALAEGLKDLHNVVLTPHIASSTVDSRDDMARMSAQNIIDALRDGKPKDMVYNI
jgi:glyoxylate reductase